MRCEVEGEGTLFNGIESSITGIWTPIGDVLRWEDNGREFTERTDEESDDWQLNKYRLVSIRLSLNIQTLYWLVWKVVIIVDVNYLLQFLSFYVLYHPRFLIKLCFLM
jgi:hypothetical protein